MTDVAPEPEKHTLTSATNDAMEKEQSGDYYVGSFFEGDPETPSCPAYISVTYDFEDAWVSDPPESEAEIVLEIGDTADRGEPELLELGCLYREIKSASWSDFVEEFRDRGVTIDDLWVEDKHPMAQGTLYIAVPSRAEEEKALSCARDLVAELVTSEGDYELAAEELADPSFLSE
jgi:hypothetical protein